MFIAAPARKIRERFDVMSIEKVRSYTVFPACGSGNSAIELTPEELEKYSGAVGWVDVCK